MDRKKMGCLAIFRFFSFALIAGITLLSLEAVSGNSTWAQDYPLSGRDLAQRVHDRENGDDVTIQGVMELISKSGRKRVRDLLIYGKDFSEITKQLIRFTSPADIEGTGFLSIEQPDGETEQFLFLPVLRRTRRIVGSQKGRSFVNSDFTYEDMERRPVDDWEHRIVGQEKIGNMDCWVLVSTPKKGTETQYSQMKIWVAKNLYIPLAVEYFDKKNKFTKKYRVLKVEKIQEIWTETEVIMEDLEKEHKTIIRNIKTSYNNKLPDTIFTKRNLENW